MIIDELNNHRRSSNVSIQELLDHKPKAAPTKPYGEYTKIFNLNDAMLNLHNWKMMHLQSL